MDEISAEKLTQYAASGLPKADRSAQGPTPTSCWIVPGLILWGDFPKGPKLAALVDCGVTDFLDTRTAGVGLGLDINAKQTCRSLDLNKLLFANSQAAIAACASFLKQTLHDMLRKENGVLYVFCEDGHSLSSVAAAAFLGFVYGLTGMKAIAVASQLHGARADDQGVANLLNAQQKAFIRDLVKDSSTMTHPSLNASTMSAAYNTSSPTSASMEGTQSTPHRRVSRFEHSKNAGGGGVTSINLFASDGEQFVDQACDSPHRRHGRGLVAGISAADSSIHLKRVESQQGLIDAVHSSGRRSAGNNDSPQDAIRSASLRGSPHDVFVVRLERPSLAHLWGLILDGCTVRHVLSGSPADQAGIRLGWTLRTVDNGEYSGDYSFDWITQDRIAVNLTMSRSSPVRHDFPDFCAIREPSATSVVPSTSSASTAPQIALPPRPFDPRLEASIIRGPFPQSNWVVRDLILCGPVPDPRKRVAFRALVDTRIDIFVSLLETDGLNEIYLQAYRAATNNERVRCIWFSMEDGTPIRDHQYEGLLQLARDVISWSVGEQKRVYIHCRQGHGRTGILVTAILGLLYQWPGMKAVNVCDALHSCREDTEDQSSPQTQEQRLSAVSLLSRADR